jgi:hypothetical protein
MSKGEYRTIKREGGLGGCQGLPGLQYIGAYDTNDVLSNFRHDVSEQEQAEVISQESILTLLET